MTRPAIVIGLGGTGQWVLTFLKKELLEIGGGEMPPGVKLLSFDTTSATAAAAGKNAAQKDEEQVRAGAVELTEDIEFIPLGDNVATLASEIRDGKHSHLQWYPAESFLAKLSPSAFNLKYGSGQIRQMGRIALFRDLGGVRTSEVLSRLRAAMQALQRDVSRNVQLEVIIVGSVAGGTGAGMLVDMALLVREQARRLVQNNYVVRGFFLLPTAFTRGGIGEDRDMLARSFAAWRELDRFMIVSERFGVRQMNYHAQNQDLRIRLNQRAYDVSYLIDPRRQSSNSLENVRAEEGVYPSVAHILSAILDDRAGQEYTEFVSTNLDGKLAQLPRNPYHSTVGSYTVKVPVYYAHTKFSHQLAKEVLDNFLAPEKNDKGIVYRVSDLRNREDVEGGAGWPTVRRFMQASSLNIDGEEIPNTDLMPLMADVRDKDGQTNAQVINQWSRGGLSREGHPVVNGLTNISQDDEGKKIQADISEELSLRVYRLLPPSRVAGDTPEQGYLRITKRIPEVRHEHYGIDDVEGGQSRGKYGKALEEAKKAQLSRFRQLLLAWTTEELNGHSDDPLVARSGKIGYVRSFYSELVKTLDYFIEFLNKVRLDRNENLKIGRRARDAAGRAQREYDRTKGKGCPFVFWDNFIHPDAHRAQRNYLRAEQNSINVRKDDILLSVLSETALDMKEFAENTRDEVDRWIEHLATGAPGVTSLYEKADESLTNANVNHVLDKRLSKVSEVIGEHEYESEQEYIADALNMIVWKLKLKGDRLDVDCGLETPSEDPNKPPWYEPFRRGGDNAARHNLNLLLELAEKPYHRLHQERPLAREVMYVYDSGHDLADEVDKKAEPLFMPASTIHGPQLRASYVRVHGDVDDRTARYFGEFEDRLEEKNPGVHVKLVDSEDPHKLTVVRSDDLIRSADFEMWHACREAYIQQVTDPHRGIPAAELHIFPAEINACHYEALMPRLLRREYRTLHPEVVALLEDIERFEMFFRAKALDFICLDESKGRPFWIYQLPDDDEPMYLTVPDTTLNPSDEEDIFQLIHNFALEGHDQRPGVGATIRVEWGRLRDAILKTQRELGKTKTVARYRRELEHAKGIVNHISHEADKKRADVNDEVLRRTVGVEYDDLADVARVVYMQAMESVR